MDITIVVPVRLGSTRCINKNLRPFAGTSLFDLKLDQLKPLKDKVVVSSSASEVLQHAKDRGFQVHLRDPWYSRSETTGAEFYECLSSAINTEWMLYTTAMCPFVSANMYIDSINLLSNQLDTYNCLASSTLVKQFLYDRGPINFSQGHAPRSQDLPDIRYTNFAINIARTSFVKEKRALVDDKPLWYDLNQLESIDIDTEFDFQCAELLYKHYSEASESSESLDS